MQLLPKIQQKRCHALNKILCPPLYKTQNTVVQVLQLIVLSTLSISLHQVLSVGFILNFL